MASVAASEIEGLGARGSAPGKLGVAEAIAVVDAEAITVLLSKAGVSSISA